MINISQTINLWLATRLQMYFPLLLLLKSRTRLGSNRVEEKIIISKYDMVLSRLQTLHAGVLAFNPHETAGLEPPQELKIGK